MLEDISMATPDQRANKKTTNSDRAPMTLSTTMKARIESFAQLYFKSQGNKTVA